MTDRLAAPQRLERHHPPLSWWVIALAIGLSVAVALAVYLPPAAAVAVIVATLLALVAALLALGLSVRVGPDELRVGGNHVDWAHVAGARALDADETRRRMGQGADARAAIMTRPYLHQAVEVTIDDPADPHPYWLVGTRTPNRLAAAITEQLARRA